MSPSSRQILCFLIALLLPLLACSCSRREVAAPTDSGAKVTVVATLFPLYDFTRTIGGERVSVTLLLPPGMEAHNFQPTPDDTIRVSRADIFLYTNAYMEPWALKFAGSLSSGRLMLVDASKGVTFLKSGRDAGHDGHHDHGAGMDPHIWLDFGNAQLMADTIAAALTARDPAGREYYAANAASLKARLTSLDNDFRSGLTNCARTTFLHGGHYAFGYLAHRYGLAYESAAAVNADAEPTPARLVELVKKVRTLGLKHVFSEELLSPRVAEIIARETGVSVLMLHGAHNISREDFAAGTSFEKLMRGNLESLRQGLQCR